MEKLVKYSLIVFVSIYTLLYLFCHNEEYYQNILGLFLLMTAVLAFLLGFVSRRVEAKGSTEKWSGYWFAAAFCLLAAGLSNAMQAVGLMIGASVVSWLCLLLAALLCYRSHKKKGTLFIAVVSLAFLVLSLKGLFPA